MVTLLQLYKKGFSCCTGFGVVLVTEFIYFSYLKQMVVSVGSGPWDQLFGGGNSPAFAVAAVAALISGFIAVLAIPRTGAQSSRSQVWGIMFFLLLAQISFEEGLWNWTGRNNLYIISVLLLLVVFFIFPFTKNTLPIFFFLIQIIEYIDAFSSDSSLFSTNDLNLEWCYFLKFWKLQTLVFFFLVILMSEWSV